MAGYKAHAKLVAGGDVVIPAGQERVDIGEVGQHDRNIYDISKPRFRSVSILQDVPTNLYVVEILHPLNCADQTSWKIKRQIIIASF